MMTGISWPPRVDTFGSNAYSTLCRSPNVSIFLQIPQDHTFLSLPLTQISCLTQILVLEFVFDLSSLEEVIPS